MDEIEISILVTPSSKDPGGKIARRAAARLREFLLLVDHDMIPGFMETRRVAFRTALFQRIAQRARATTTLLRIQFDASDYCAAMREAGVCDACKKELPLAETADGGTARGVCSCGGPCDPTYMRCQKRARHEGRCEAKWKATQQYEVDLTKPAPGEEAVRG